MTVTHVLSLAPNNALAHYLRWAGILLQHQPRTEGMAEFERALALDPNLAWAHAELGTQRILDGRAEETEAQENEAIRLSPRDPDAYWWLYFIAVARSSSALTRKPSLGTDGAIEINRNVTVHALHVRSCVGGAGAARRSAGRSSNRACARPHIHHPHTSASALRKATIRFT